MKVLISPPAERNKEPILRLLERVLPSSGTVLEIASGTGQHVVHFAAALPALYWIPSDPDPRHRESIAAHTAQAKLDNVAPPLDIDVLREWGVGPVEAVIVANLLHIAPREVLPALCSGAAAALVPGGVLHVYGPFKRAGRHTSEGNARFDVSLRAEDPRWGLWDVEDVLEAARDRGFTEEAVVDMPANNLSLVLRASVQPR